MNKITKEQLKIRQSLPLDMKIKYTKRRIEEFVDYYGLDRVYVSFSGGKDSTVLLHIARSIYPDIKAMWVDTGLEYPEIKEFVKTIPNVDICRPKMPFHKVIETYGFPIVSKEVSECVYNARKHIEDGEKYKRHYDKLIGNGNYNDNLKQYSCTKWKFLLDAPFKISHKCCLVMKKTPAHTYEKQTGRYPIIGTMTEESRLRQTDYLRNGCNSFEGKIKSNPIAFWTEQDVLRYIKENNVQYASCYGDIVEVDLLGKLKTTKCDRTGCMFCGFGCHLEKGNNRFQRLKETHPKYYDYIINKLGMGKVLDYIKVKY